MSPAEAWKANAMRQHREWEEEDRRCWPDGHPNQREPMTWRRYMGGDVARWIFSGVDPGAYPPRWECAIIEERAPHFRWEVGADKWTYDAGYARSLGVAMRRAEEAYRECWPDLVAEFEAKAKAPPAKPKDDDV